MAQTSQAMQAVLNAKSELKGWLALPKEQQMITPLSRLAQGILARVQRKAVVIPLRAKSEPGQGDIENVQGDYQSLLPSRGDVKDGVIGDVTTGQTTGRQVGYRNNVNYFTTRTFTLNPGDVVNVLNYNEAREYLLISNAYFNPSAIAVYFYAQTAQGIATPNPDAIYVQPADRYEPVRRLPCNEISVHYPAQNLGQGTIQVVVIEA